MTSRCSHDDGQYLDVVHPNVIPSPVDLSLWFELMELENPQSKDCPGIFSRTLFVSSLQPFGMSLQFKAC